MQLAFIRDNEYVSANNYNASIHGNAIFCMDNMCRAPVHHVRESDKVAFFKTSGKGLSVHTATCAFARKLPFTTSVVKTSQLQKEIGRVAEPILVRFNPNKYDPDYVKKERSHKDESEEANSKNIKVPSEKSDTPKSITSLKSIKKLFTSCDPDILAAVQIRINGTTLPLSSIVTDHASAHKTLWDGLAYNIPYVVFGEITSILRLPKVWYFNMQEDNYYFTIVIFEKHFKHFTYKDEDLLNKEILVMGKLKKNTFRQDKQSTEIVVKADAYIEFLED